MPTFVFVALSSLLFAVAALFPAFADTNPNLDFNCTDETECTANFYVDKGKTTIVTYCYRTKVTEIKYSPPPQLETSCKASNASVTCIVGGSDGCQCSHDTEKQQRVTARIKDCCVRNNSCPGGGWGAAS